MPDAAAELFPRRSLVLHKVLWQAREKAAAGCSSWLGTVRQFSLGLGCLLFIEG
jgi:hypothetical protein